MKFKKFMKEIKDEVDVAIDPYFSSCPDNLPKKIIGCDWSTGGLHGNCWDSTMSSSDAQEEPELQDLDTILTHFAPKITFLQYKTLCKELIKRGTTCEMEYYGGHSNYGYKYIELRALYDYLKDTLKVFEDGDGDDD